MLVSELLEMLSTMPPTAVVEFVTADDQLSAQDATVSYDHGQAVVTLDTQEEGWNHD